jgi:hypothetical protein
MRGMLHIRMTLIRINITVSFGIDAEIFETGAVVTLAGTIGLEAHVEANVPLDSFRADEHRIGIGGEGTGRIDATAEVRVLGETIIGGHVSAASGIELVEGAITFAHDPARFAFSGLLRTKPLVVRGALVAPGHTTFVIGPYSFLGEHEIYRFH